MKPIAEVLNFIATQAVNVFYSRRMSGYHVEGLNYEGLPAVAFAYGVTLEQITNDVTVLGNRKLAALKAHKGGPFDTAKA